MTPADFESVLIVRDALDGMETVQGLRALHGISAPTLYRRFAAARALGVDLIVYRGRVVVANASTIGPRIRSVADQIEALYDMETL